MTQFFLFGRTEMSLENKHEFALRIQCQLNLWIIRPSFPTNQKSTPPENRDRASDF